MTSINGKLTKVFLGNEDHGVYSFCLMFDFDGCSQGTGHYCLANPARDNEVDNTGKLIRGLLAIAEVDDWSKIEGKYCRVIRESEDWSARIIKIGHIIKDIWLDIKTLELTND